jgi:hypothetical protein
MLRNWISLMVALGLAAGQTSSLASHKDDAAALFWRDPGPIEKLDFGNGSAWAGRPPQPPFRFVDESLAGTNPKIRVVDANGTKWMMKFGEEGRPQTFAALVVSALGYVALPTYFVSKGTVLDIGPLQRAAKYVKSDGRFASASLEPYLDSSIHWSDDAASWSWDANPFLGTRQLKGLKILVMLFANWDNKDARDLETSWTTAGTPGSNTAILTYPSGEARYLVTDWGASMGTWGSYLTRSKWNCTGFDLQTKEFVKVGRGDVLQWGYLGRHTQDFVADIELDDVHWLLMYLGRITDAQLKDGLLASGASQTEAGCFTRALRKRITALQALR